MTVSYVLFAPRTKKYNSRVGVESTVPLGEVPGHLEAGPAPSPPVAVDPAAGVEDAAVDAAAAAAAAAAVRGLRQRRRRWRQRWS